ncbi:hypothetical protein DTL42_22030 [Bremerella cremea]|uniref:Uncharacterized protein n=1 Tax=Bremerella cremea TaxID=1031537 RepID=A0A368KNZ9_9BACT|nr:hypothetical protein [Bremerella cremea]RCS41250.1 hypothetical protein DTL42_22030 [Bremerella cremea]
MASESTNRNSEDNANSENANSGCGCVTVMLGLVIWFFIWLFMPSSSNEIELPEQFGEEKASEIDENTLRFTKLDAQVLADTRREAVAITEEYNRLIAEGATDSEVGKLERRVARVERELKEWLKRINRQPGQPGYSLEARREAAKKTLMQEGFSEIEAVLNVQAMIEHGMLPDPPRTNAEQSPVGRMPEEITEEPPTVTKDNYEKIKRGMFHLEVEVLLGYDDELRQDITVGDTRIQTYIWRSRRGGYILITFHNDYFYSKTYQEPLDY